MNFRLEINEFIWMPELSVFFWIMISIILFFTVYDIVKEIYVIRHRNHLIKEFNDGTCPICGGEYEQIECEDEYGRYRCTKCGNEVIVDDGDVDFNWNYRKLL